MMTETIIEPVESPEEELEPTTEETTEEAAQVDEEPDTFPRDYVEKLRKEAAAYREKAKGRDELAQRLHTALVAATGRLADPSDLAFDEAHLDDEEALTAALDELLDRKPHLASRRPRGDVGQGATANTTTVNLAGLLRARA